MDLSSPPHVLRCSEHGRRYKSLSHPLSPKETTKRPAELLEKIWNERPSRRLACALIILVDARTR